MSITTHHSHAAPYIRYHIVLKLGQSRAASRQRDRRESRAWGNSLAQALQILLESETSKAELPGVADFDTIPHDYVASAKEILGRDWDRLGFTEETSI